ncbi:uncharacterized transporter slc-17.2-like isoform X1 [Schistocerca serialis cubense]|uniref:uncharacterized transporter slc-17.2-like isoform X1 n=1 Tax=Schistocerca serialis cubense TaxID=2023355 RepID=UPI00214E7C34|nr:uncharacterized transporter slc-17.2-like isoform X1 [Schistocerca serialis cubense]
MATSLPHHAFQRDAATAASAATSSNNDKGCCSARSVLWYLIFCGCVVNFMVTTNINIAIVAMVRPRRSNATEVLPAAVLECGVAASAFSAPNSTSAGAELLAVENATDGLAATTQLPDVFNVSAVDEQQAKRAMERRYPWDEYQQGLVLGGFFWLHWATQIPGGVLAQRYGTKLVYGASNAAISVLCFAIPAAAAADYRLVVALRVLQGLIAGLVWPAMHNIIAAWIPPAERSTFVTAYTGGSMGVALTFCLGGVLVSAWGWPSLFHVTGALGVLWFAAWWLLVYDTPARHPRISDRERRLIADALGAAVSTKRPRTPWASIATSWPLWLTVVVHWASNMGIFTLMTQAPTYFKYIHGWDMGMTGMLSGLPHILRTLFGYGFSRLSDFLLSSGRATHTVVRRIATFVCCPVMGVLTLGLAFCGCQPVWAAVLLAAATAVSGAISSGPLASLVDLSPNFAGILMGVSCTLGFTAAFISPLIVSVLTYNNQTTAQWQLVYIVVSVLLAAPGAVYTCCATSELQPWNSTTARERVHTQVPPAELHALTKPDDDSKDAAGA